MTANFYGYIAHVFTRGECMRYYYKFFAFFCEWACLLTTNYPSIQSTKPIFLSCLNAKNKIKIVATQCFLKVAHAFSKKRRKTCHSSSFWFYIAANVLVSIVCRLLRRHSYNTSNKLIKIASGLIREHREYF